MVTATVTVTGNACFHDFAETVNESDRDHVVNLMVNEQGYEALIYENAP
jgi:hypothetical protein